MLHIIKVVILYFKKLE